MKLSIKDVEFDTSTRRSKVIFRIDHQTGRKSSFAKNGSFEASNGLRITSDMYPAYYDGEVVYIKGSDEANDNIKVVVPKHIFDLFVEAMNEYNKRYDIVSVEDKLFEL